DAKTLLDANKPVEAAINDLFVPAQESKVDLVRIAAHFNEAEQCESMIKAFKEMGYIVGLNLMQAGGKPSVVIAEKVQAVAKANP
ncbi:pyruvate carboxyltransferase, partial [Vibrio alginolyticus]